ncbi:MULTISPECIES: DoxX-like family protein [unclassified Pseudoalteromonas]|uniref:DoxX-like family protein n=1 Tax=unclassified Pseudoalteromonas TaxID=194690 RepID=UPI0020971BFC|nr:DoxX-like family protein [Pseudoalteromonas sp. XMcav2-N]MCO7189039.1 DoxX-like family protein [Pseudoalteromonas sp. XMcav2-N]
MSTTQLARLTIAFVWLYHGLVPKLLHVAPLEWQISASLGLEDALTHLLIRFAGIGEIIWAIVFFIWYRTAAIIYMNIIALVGLLLAVAVLQPVILFEAFNPLTTNLPLIVLSALLLPKVPLKKTTSRE